VNKVQRVRSDTNKGYFTNQLITRDNKNNLCFNVKLSIFIKRIQRYLPNCCIAGVLFYN
jgi:hypothetical protein